MTKSAHVLGGEGFIGSNLVARLRAGGHGVTMGIRPLAPNKPEDFAEIVASNDWVVHAASASTPSSSATDPLHELDDNLRTTLCLVQALQQAPHCGVIYLSSSGTLYGELLDREATELDPVRPRTYHGAGKVAAEHFLHSLCLQFGNPVVSVRPSNVYGPGQRSRPGFGIIPTAFERCLDGQPLNLWGDGCNIRDYLYVDDLSDLLTRVICADPAKKYDVVNASSGSGHSLLQLVEAIRNVTRKELDVSFQPARQLDARRIVPNSLHAAAKYGWRATTPLHEGLERAWAWHKENARP